MESVLRDVLGLLRTMSVMGVFETTEDGDTLGGLISRIEVAVDDTAKARPAFLALRHPRSRKEDVLGDQFPNPADDRRGGQGDSGHDGGSDPGGPGVAASRDCPEDAN